MKGEIEKRIEPTKRGFFESADRIFAQFDKLTNLRFEGEGSIISAFVSEFIDCSLEGSGEAYDKWSGLLSVGFALGFVFGSIAEVTDPEFQQDIATIRKTIKEERLLPYFPREKKVA